MHLSDMANAVRSKNAGPCILTIDLLFPDSRSFEIVAERAADLAAYAALTYRVPPEEVRVHPCPPANAIKLTLPRATVSGSVGDTDVYGAQQHRPLLDFEI